MTPCTVECFFNYYSLDRRMKCHTLKGEKNAVVFILVLQWELMVHTMLKSVVDNMCKANTSFQIEAT